MGNVLDRRSFLKGAALTATAASAFAIVGCSGNNEEVDQIAWDEEYDVVVVGAGFAGLSSALTVATEGDGATCLLLEKDPVPSGNSPMSMGMTLFTDTPDTLFEYVKKLADSSTPDDVLRAYVDGLAENYSWIRAMGADEGDLYVAPPSPAAGAEYPEMNIGESYSMFMFTGMAGGAQHGHIFLLDAIQKHADTITYKPSTAMEALILDNATKTVLGVVAGGKHYKATRGVIMCCGGFENDAEMLETYHGMRGVQPYASKSNTGDGHRACLAAGAKEWHMTNGALYWMAARNLQNTSFMSTVWHFSTKEFGITVGVNGRRFYQDWDGCAVPNPMAGTPYAMPGDNLALGVGYRHGLCQFGGRWTHLPFPEKAWFIFDADALAAGAIPAEVSSDPVADGWAYAADSIEELAQKIDVPVDELVRTVNTWNGFCEQGQDLAFYRPAQSLNPVAQGPFYAMLCVPAMLNTDGGPVRSAKGEIIDTLGKPIPHLYSAGEFGSVWGNLYQGAGNVGECMAFGRISARTALANI